MVRLREKLAHWAPFDRQQLCLGLANYGFYYKGLKPGEKADGPLSRYGSYIAYRGVPAPRGDGRLDRGV